MIRRFFVCLHRWAGLLMACLLGIVGLTGSLLAFGSEIDHLLSPRFFAKPQPGVAVSISRYRLPSRPNQSTNC